MEQSIKKITNFYCHTKTKNSKKNFLYFLDQTGMFSKKIVQIFYSHQKTKISKILLYYMDRI